MTTTTPAPPAPASPGLIDDPLPSFLARAVPLVAAGWLLGGWIGLAAAALGVASTYRRPASLVAAAAPVMLVLAALATVIEVPIDDDALRSSFADDRPTAATAGLIAALFALIAVVTMAVRDRRPAPALATPDVAVDAAATSSRDALATTLRRVAPVLGIAAGTLVALALLAPSPPTATDAVADNVRIGLGWGTTVEGVVVVDGTEPPLAVVVTAIAPGGAALWTGIAGACAVGATAALVARRAGRRETLLAAGAVALGLVVVRADLAGCLAAALVAAALLAGDPDGRTTGSAALAGAAFGGAVLAFPVLGLVLPLVVAALTFDPRTREVTVAHGLAGLAAAVAVVAPWQRWLVERFATWAPAAEVTVPLASLLAVVVLAAAVALPLAASRRS